MVMAVAADMHMGSRSEGDFHCCWCTSQEPRFQININNVSWLLILPWRRKNSSSSAVDHAIQSRHSSACPCFNTAIQSRPYNSNHSQIAARFLAVSCCATLWLLTFCGSSPGNHLVWYVRMSQLGCNGTGRPPLPIAMDSSAYAYNIQSYIKNS